VAAEVALAVVVTIAAGLLVRTVHNLSTVDAGFDRSRLVTFAIALPAATYTEPGSRVQLFQRLLDRVRALPGVQSASAMTGLPPIRPLNANDTDIDNYTPAPGGPPENVAYYQSVMSDYFETMGIPIVEGRSFERTDIASSGMVAIVNETLADTFWPGLNPIGQRLRPCCGDAVPWFTVIGVAKDVKQGGLDQPAGTEFYRLVEQSPLAATATSSPLTMNVVLRSTLEPELLSPSLARMVRDLDPSVPIVRLREMDAVFDEILSRPRLLAQFVAGFAGLALLLAAIGTYGVLSYMVVERRREIGIRMALGASRGTVLRLVIRQGLLLTAVGLVAGLAGAAGVNRLMASLLFGVRPTDTATMIGVIVGITAIASLACWLPSWRASRLDPNVVLREE
jgi:predicted permease